MLPNGQSGSRTHSKLSTEIEISHSIQQQIFLMLGLTHDSLLQGKKICQTFQSLKYKSTDGEQ